MNRSKLLKKLAVSLMCAGCFAASNAAFATPCTDLSSGSGATIGGASTDDVKLGGADSDACAFSNVNAAAGPSGNTSGFASAFPSSSDPWVLVGKVETNSGTVSGSGLTLTLNATGTTGTWTATNTTSGALTLDLVLAIHAGEGSGAFLFDDQAFTAGQTLNGTFVIDWLNNGRQVPDFSNGVFFVRDVDGSGGGDGGQVPEPGSLALIGLGMLGVASLRRRNRV